MTILGLVMAVVAAAPAHAQTTGPSALSPTAPPAPVDPLPSAVTPTPSATPPPPAAVPPAVAVESPAPTPASPDRPIVERWWFWTAIGAFAITAVVIVAASSGPSTPRTDLGNMPAF